MRVLSPGKCPSHAQNYPRRDSLLNFSLLASYQRFFSHESASVCINLDSFFHYSCQRWTLRGGYNHMISQSIRPEWVRPMAEVSVAGGRDQQSQRTSSVLLPRPPQSSHIILSPLRDSFKPAKFHICNITLSFWVQPTGVRYGCQQTV